MSELPTRYRSILEQLGPTLTVQVAGYPVTVPLNREEAAQVYLPLLALLHTLAVEHGRVVAGLAGIPGSGKSTFCAVLEALAAAVLGIGKLGVVGLDGWHFPNTVLDERTTLGTDGQPVPLRQRKGGPESFDINGLALAIESVRTQRGIIRLPIYDRRLHDPVADGITIGPGTSIIIIEGNFLLDRNPPWRQVSALLDPLLFIECDPAAARQRVIERHIRGGATPEQAESKFETNDRLNTQTVLATASNAAYRIAMQPQPGLFRCPAVT